MTAEDAAGAARWVRIDGWLVVDKPAGMTSTQALGRVRRATRAAKLGHGGTLDPAAVGVLPVALGEATKTVPWCQNAAKVYRFTLRWGAATATDDGEGDVVATSPVRPRPDRIEDALAAFTGSFEQVPPAFSAVKLAGRRAYDLARRGLPVAPAPRRVTVHSLRLLNIPDRDRATLEAVCGKGTYIRALGRDLARRLGTVGHVAALRRTRVGPFLQTMAIAVDRLGGCGKSALPSGALLPVETALDDIPALAVTAAQASLLRQGRQVAVAGEGSGIRRVAAGRCLVAVGEVAGGRLRPLRVFNLSGEEDVDHR